MDFVVTDSFPAVSLQITWQDLFGRASGEGPEAHKVGGWKLTSSNLLGR